MARAGCKFIVHFSMLFSTTRTSFRKNGTLLSCRLSHSRLRHLLDDFRKCRFGRLLFCFSLIHILKFSRARAVYWSILIKQSFLVTTCSAQKLDRDKTAVESHLLLQIIVRQITAITIRVEPMIEMDLVQIRGNDLLAKFMRLRAHKRHVPAS